MYINSGHIRCTRFVFKPLDCNCLEEGHLTPDLRKCRWLEELDNKINALFKKHALPSPEDLKSRASKKNRDSSRANTSSSRGSR